LRRHSVSSLKLAERPRRLIDQALRDLGDRVLITQNPLEVLDVARKVRIDLLVTEFETDQALPTLIDETRSTQPDVRVLYISDEKGPAEPDANELSTPFSLDELREAVAACLDRRADGS
jgi:DNA-binding NtrC family response regulator